MNSSTSVRITKRQSAAIAAAGILAAGVGLVALVMSARTLSVEENTKFTLFWSVLFFAFAITVGLSLEMTRAVTADTLVSDSDSHGEPGVEASRSGHGAGRTVGAIAVAAMLTVLVVVGGTLPVWRHTLSPLSGASGMLVCVCVAVGMTGYVGHVALTGALAGQRKWTWFAAATILESTLRLAFLTIAMLTDADVLGFAVATVLPEYAWVGLVIFSGQVRDALRHRVRTPVTVFLKRVVSAMLGQVAAALLLAGYPWLLGMTTPTRAFGMAAPFITAISLTRAPIMTPVTTFQSVIVAHFARRRGSGGGQLALIVGIPLGLGIVGGALAWLVGPPLLALIKPEYAISGVVLAGLTLSAGFVTALTLTGILCQSSASYRQYLVGWYAAVAGTVVILLLDMPMEPRAILALICGTACGIAVHVAFLVRRSRTLAHTPTRET